MSRREGRQPFFASDFRTADQTGNRPAVVELVRIFPKELASREGQHSATELDKPNRARLGAFKNSTSGVVSRIALNRGQIDKHRSQ
jgi:hypothetical protein